MKRLLIALLVVVLPVITAYSGTFVDDFSDGNLEGWNVLTAPPVHDDFVRLEGGHLVLDTAHKENDPPLFKFRDIFLELRTGNAENWDSYTLTCRIRFKEFPPEEEEGRLLYVAVRADGVAQQRMLILPVIQTIQVITIPPDAQKIDPETGKVPRHIHRGTLIHKDLRRPIRLNRWLRIKIVAERHSFEFHFDDNLVAQYEDETAVPGTVRINVRSEMLIHLDDVVITGPGIPNIGGASSVNPEAHLATTWGKIKQPWRR